jgi:hypothetical protein
MNDDHLQIPTREPISVIIMGYQLQTKNIEYSSHKISSYLDEIAGDHQCIFWRNRSTTDQIFCIRQALKKK